MRALRKLPALACVFALAGCAPFNYVGSDSPEPLTVVAPMQSRPRIALVLGSGGPRGYAHIGALKVLEAAGIEIDMVVGSSVGSLIGAFWAYGYSADRIDQIAQTGGPLTLFDLSPFADRGWIRGQRLQDYVNLQLADSDIGRLPRRLVVAATRRDDKAPVFFQRGNIGVAVRASSAVPGIISPVGINGVEYEDADESLPVAVRAARQAGARFVIAIDVSARPGSAPPGTPRSMLDRDDRRRARIDPEVSAADFVIHPDMGYMASPRASYFARAQAAGEVTTKEILPLLRRRLRESGLAAGD